MDGWRNMQKNWPNSDNHLLENPPTTYCGFAENLENADIFSKHKYHSNTKTCGFQRIKGFQSFPKTMISSF